MNTIAGCKPYFSSAAPVGTSLPQGGEFRQYHSATPTSPPATTNRQGKPLNPMQRLGQRMIRWYQGNEFIHGKLYKAINLRCMYKKEGHSDLSCSEYGLKAIQEKGFVKGSLFAYARMLSCNPFTLHRKKPPHFVDIQA